MEALNEGVLMAPLDARYTQVELYLIPVQVCEIDAIQSDLLDSCFLSCISGGSPGGHVGNFIAQRVNVLLKSIKHLLLTIFFGKIKEKILTEWAMSPQVISVA